MFLLHFLQRLLTMLNAGTEKTRQKGIITIQGVQGEEKEVVRDVYNTTSYEDINVGFDDMSAGERDAGEVLRSEWGRNTARIHCEETVVNRKVT